MKAPEDSKSQAADADLVNSRARKPGPVRRILKWVAVAVLAAVGLVLIASALLLIPSIRGQVLRVALPRALEYAPGRLTVAGADWPGLGSLLLTGVSWQDDSLTVLSADTVSVSVRVWPLVRRDIKVEHAVAHGVYLDLPALRGLVAPADTAAPEEVAEEIGEEEDSWFPREGSIPGLPSIAVDSVSVTASTIKLGPTSALADLRFQAGFDLAHGGQPGAHLDGLKLRGEGDGWRVDDLTLAFDLADGVARGSGAAAITPDLPLFLSVDSPAPDHVTIVLSKVPDSGPPEVPGITAALALTRDGIEVTRVEYHAKVRTPGSEDLGSIPAIAARADRIPATDGITLEISGAVQLKPDVAAVVYCEIFEPELLDEAVVALRYEGEAVTLDSLIMAATDLRLRSFASLTPDSLLAHVDVDLTGSDGRKRFVPGLGVPDSLEALVAAAFALERDTGMGDARVNARARVGGFSLDTLIATSRIALEEDGITSTDLIASTRDLVISMGADVSAREEIVVRTEPILIRVSRGHPGQAGQWLGPRPELEQTGEIVYSPDTRAVSVDGMEIVGDLGEVKLDVHLDETRSGRFTVRCEWPEPPAPLLSVLTGAGDPEDHGTAEATVDSLLVAWGVGAPYWLDVEGVISSEGGMSTLTADAKFKLPGPQAMAPLLPDGARVGDLGPVTGLMHLRRQSAGTAGSFDVVADLTGTDWVDSSAVHVWGRGDSIGVETLKIVAGGLDFDVRGGMDFAADVGGATVDLSDTGFLRRFLPSMPELDLTATGTYSGAGVQPGIDATLQGSIRGDGYDIPLLRGTLNHGPGRTAASLRLPEGMLARAVRVDSVAVDYATSENAEGYFPARINLSASGQELELDLSTVLDVGDQVVCRVEDLGLAVRGKGLRAQRPFRLVFDGDAEAVVIEGMDLSGGLGQIAFDGIASAESVDIRGFVAVELAEPPPPALGIPSAIWPNRLESRIEATGRTDLHVDATVEGLTLDDGSEVALLLEVVGGQDGVRSRIHVSDEEANLVEGTVALPAVISIYPPGLDFGEGDVSVEMEFDGYPVALQGGRTGSEGPGGTHADLDGEIRMWGSVAEPSGYVRTDFTFPDWAEMSDFHISATGALGPRSSGDPDTERRLLDLDHEVMRLLGTDRTEGMICAVRVRSGEEALLDGAVSYPGLFGVHPFGLETQSERSINALVKSDGLDLARISPLLPAGVGLGGRCAMDISAGGPVDDPSVSGTFRADDVSISVERTARVLLAGGLEVGGTAMKPSISGRFTIENGIITIPEVEPSLHPKEGEAILLHSEWRAHVDTVVGSPARPQPAEKSEPEQPAFQPHYDVVLDIPSSFWLRGEGLEIEFRGELQVVQGDGQPVITGDLLAQRGSLLFLGRTFDLERGDVIFYGTDEINPSLDISLTSSIQDTKVWIKLTGTLEKPDLELASQPEMTEGDIMAMILFGRPLDQLNDGQDNMLRDRSAEILIAMGAAKLQERLAGQAGIDLVALRSARDSAESSALVVGKYITPKLLVMYEQGLSERTTSYIVMEYLLHRNLRLETLYNNQDKSSAGLSLETEY